MKRCPHRMSFCSSSSFLSSIQSGAKIVDGHFKYLSLKSPVCSSLSVPVKFLFLSLSFSLSHTDTRTPFLSNFCWHTHFLSLTNYALTCFDKHSFSFNRKYMHTYPARDTHFPLSLYCSPPPTHHANSHTQFRRCSQTHTHSRSLSLSLSLSLSRTHSDSSFKTFRQLGKECLFEMIAFYFN